MDRGFLSPFTSVAWGVVLESVGLPVEKEVPVPIFFRGQAMADDGFRMDMVVAGQIVLELKSVQALQDVHKKQLLTYLRLAGKPLGLLINFNVSLLKDGIIRIAN